MKITLALLRIDVDDLEHYRLVAYKHYESGNGRAGVDPRALAAAQFGTIAQNVHMILEWKPFDFANKGGVIIDLGVFAEAMANDHVGLAEAIEAGRKAMAAWAKRHPIPDDEHGTDRP